jgi:gp32 DNA binding protein like
MTNMINSSIFQSIKGALAQESSNTGLSEILKTEPGNVYTVRLLPAKDPKKTFFHFFTHGWTSYSSGQYVAALSPQTFGERDPIAEERFRILRTGTEAEKEKAKSIGRSEKWLVNVYVVNDPKTPENNGKVKILRYGKQLQKIITDAIEGEDADELGARIFDLSPNGCNLKIKVEKQGDYPSYVSSKFSMPSALPELDDAKGAKIYGNVFELDKIFTLKSADELKTMLDEHYHCKTVKDDVIEVTKPTMSAPTIAPATNKSSDDDIKNLLDGLDINS